MSLRRALDTIDIVEKHSIINGHDYIANKYTYLDFG